MRPTSKLHILLLSCILLCISTTYAQKTEPTIWNDHKIIVDGDNQEWQQPYTYSNVDNRIQYAVANDRHTLFLTLKTSNDVSMYKIIKGGLYVYIDTLGGKDLSTALLCFIKKEGASAEEEEELPANSMPTPGDTSHKHVVRPRIADVKLTVTKTIAAGFTRCNGTYTQQNQCPCGLHIAAMMNDLNEMVWEIAVPFAMLGKDSLAAADLDKKISIGMAMDALPDGDRPPARTGIMAAVPRTMPPPTNDATTEHHGKAGGTKPENPEGDASAMAPQMEDFTPVVDWSTIDDINRLTKIIYIWKKVRLSYK